MRSCVAVSIHVWHPSQHTSTSPYRRAWRVASHHLPWDRAPAHLPGRYRSDFVEGVLTKSDERVEDANLFRRQGVHLEQLVQVVAELLKIDPPQIWQRNKTVIGVQAKGLVVIGVPKSWDDCHRGCKKIGHYATHCKSGSSAR